MNYHACTYVTCIFRETCPWIIWHLARQANTAAEQAALVYWPFVSDLFNYLRAIVRYYGDPEG